MKKKYFFIILSINFYMNAEEPTKQSITRSKYETKTNQQLIKSLLEQEFERRKLQACIPPICWGK